MSRRQKSVSKLVLAALAVAAVAATPLVGSATDLANAPFAIRAVNTDGSGKFAVRPLVKTNTGTGSTTPPIATTPVPDPEPTRAPDESPNTVSMTIDTSLSGCTAMSSTGFQLNVAAVNPADATKTPLPASAQLSWGDGSNGSLTTGANAHLYKSGKYTINIEGKFGGFDALSTGSASCVSSVDHLGENTGIVTLSGFLNYAPWVKSVAAPPTSLRNADKLFFNARNFNGDMTGWVLPNLETAKSMFQGASSFDGDLSNLNPKSLQSTDSMFSGSTAFTGKGLDKWKTPSLNSVNGMFANAAKFNADISNWDTSKITVFNSMFSGAKIFNQPIGKWDVSNGKSFHSMFVGTTVFNQPLDSWNMSKATTLVQMFMETGAFNQDLNSWDVSNVTDMTNMFRSAKAFDGKIDRWNTSKVTDMFYMFWGTSAFKQNISAWNVARVTNWTGFYTASLLKSSYPSYVPSKFQNSTGSNG